jgi:hypothetical protein
MPVTINVNGLSLVHKGSMGVTMATIPDVCKTPSPGGPVPIPYPNIAMSKDLTQGTTSVEADGGNSCAHRPSNFVMSTGDEPGTAGGVKSGVFKQKATWITFSFDVVLEGKGACRLTDKMFMNNENTVSMGGEVQAPVSPDDIVYKLCEIACECKNAALRQKCVADKIKETFYDGDYPKPDSPIWREVSMQVGQAGWEIISNTAGTGPTSNPYTPGGGIRPDIVLTDGAGNPTRIIEMKFPGDSLNANQVNGSAYDQAAADLGVDYDVLDLDPENPDENPCAFCWDPPPPSGSPVPAAESEPADNTLRNVGVVAGLALLACAIAEPCGAALVAAAGLTGATVLATQ